MSTDGVFCKFLAPKTASTCNKMIEPEPNLADVRTNDSENSPSVRQRVQCKTLMLRKYDCPIGQYLSLLAPAGVLTSRPKRAFTRDTDSATSAHPSCRHNPDARYVAGQEGSGLAS